MTGFNKSDILTHFFFHVTLFAFILLKLERIWLSCLAFMMALQLKNEVLKYTMGLETMRTTDYQFLFDSQISWINVIRKFISSFE